jgi:MFS family permease
MRLWAAQAISTFGARIARTGLPLAAVLVIHARPAELGFIAALSTAPALLVSLFSGGIVDRSRRRPIMIYADLVRAAALLLVPVSAALGNLSTGELYLAAACVGGASALFDIADHAYLPSLIGKSDLVEGNAKLGVTESIAEIGGPALAGLLVQLLTAPIAIGFNALTYLASAYFLGTIRVVETPRIAKNRSPWHHDIRAALRVILSIPMVRPLFLMAILSPLFGAFFSALYTVFAINVLGLSPGLLGVTIGVGGIGALLGASASPMLCRRFGIGPTIVFGNLISALSAFFVPLATGPVILKLAMLMAAQLLGDSLAVAAIIPASSLRQSVVPADMLGRTAALFQAGAGAAAVAGALAGGMLGEVLGIRGTLFLSASGILLVTSIGLFSPLTKLKEMPGQSA